MNFGFDFKLGYLKNKLTYSSHFFIGVVVAVPLRLKYTSYESLQAEFSNLLRLLTIISRVCIPITIHPTFILIKLWPLFNLEFKVKLCVKAVLKLYNLHTTYATAFKMCSLYHHIPIMFAITFFTSISTKL
jgi:hypothetical protein